MRDPVNRFFSLMEHPREAILIQDIPNIRYLTGFHVPNACIVIFRDRMEVFADFTYYPMLKKSGLKGHIHCAEKIPILDALLWLKDKKIKFLRIDPAKTSMEFQDIFQKVLPNAEWQDAGSGFDRIRSIKTRNEISIITQAVHASEEALNSVLSGLKDGITEKQLAASLNAKLVQLTGESPFFPTMVAFGENTAFPHWVSMERRLTPGDTILIDWGASLSGYGADLTRTLFWKKMSARQKNSYKAVFETVKTIKKCLRPGVNAGEIDRIARQCMDQFGLGEYFVHPLGHGIGLDVHEPPFFYVDSKDGLMINMVVALEPGMFIPGWGGIRIEETLCLSSVGAISLSETPIEDTPVLN